MAAWDLNGGGNQLWTLIKKGDYYTIRSLQNRLAISAVTDEATKRTRIVQDTEGDSDTQLWKFIPKENGKWAIQSKKNGTYLRMNAEKKLILSPDKEEKNTSWELTDAINRILSPEEMEKDLAFYLNTVKDIHPDLYAYTPQEKIDQKKNEVAEYIRTPRSYSGFFRKISEMNTLFDGHTHIYRSGENIKHTNYYGQNKGLFFPYRITREIK